MVDACKVNKRHTTTVIIASALAQVIDGASITIINDTKFR